MKKVFTLNPKEDWIVDRLVQEWNSENGDMVVYNPVDADVIWLLASWCYKQIDRNLLISKKVVTTVHHIVEDKFDAVKLQDFKERDSFTDVYHVPNLHTHSFVKQITNKPVVVIPYWANQKIWQKTGSKVDLRKKHGLPTNSYIVGSFQRDTEGHDLKSPKLEKGPDLFLRFIEQLKAVRKNDLHVVLAGWRRQYVMNGLNALHVDYDYFEKPEQSIVNDLYQCLDLYPVTSRHEGGPQALIESGLLGVPVISRDVGIASVVLPRHAISDEVFNAIPAIPNVENLKFPKGFEEYRKLIQKT